MSELENKLNVLMAVAVVSACIPQDDYAEESPLCFPVDEDSLRPREKSVVNGYYGLRSNFADSRGGGARKHKGVDIYTIGPGNVVSIDDGAVVQTSRAGEGTRTGVFADCGTGMGGTGGPTGFMKVYHESVDMTVLYGEIDLDDVARFSRGDSIRKGDYLGNATHCGMLHFELYRGQVSNGLYRSWPRSEEQPSDLMNPEALLRTLRNRNYFCRGNR